MGERVEIVPVGEYRISKNTGVKLGAVVGSCVAVALYDPHNKVAGMLHAVIPGQRGAPRDDRNAYYADTGTFMLLEEMKNSGARMDGIKAHMAGGGSLTQGESSETIGLGNLNAVRNALLANGIQVEEAGIGGKIGRKIELNVGTGRVEVVRTTRNTTAGITESDAVFKEELVDEIVRVISLVRPNPTVSAELMSLLHQNPIDWQCVWKTVSKDMILVLHVFRLFNSLSYGQPGRIASYRSGLERLGANHVRRLLLIAANLRNSKVMLNDQGKHSTQISRHALATGIVSRCLARLDAPGYGEEAFTAGILHDLGSLISLLPISQPPPTRHQGVENTGMVKNDPSAVPLLEMKKLSAAILAKIGIPAGVIEAVSGTEQNGGKTGVPNPLTDIIIQACGICKNIGTQPVIGDMGCHLPDITSNGKDPEIGGLPHAPDILSELKEWGF